MSDDYVRWLQTSLNKATGSSLRVDGQLGRLTKSAMISFQISRGLTPDGIAGQKTEGALIAAGAPQPPKHSFHASRTSHKQWVSEVAPLLNKYRGDIPFEFLLGWIDMESGGLLAELSPLQERGYFQMHPDESRDLGLQHERLSTDADYSIRSGIKLLNSYATRVATRGFPRGTDLFWHLVKFCHAIGGTAAARILDEMEKSGARPKSWAEVESYAQCNEGRLLHVLKHSPTKWAHKVDELFARGRSDLAFVARQENW